jgi:hypothetical protein
MRRSQKRTVSGLTPASRASSPEYNGQCVKAFDLTGVPEWLKAAPGLPLCPGFHGLSFSMRPRFLDSTVFSCVLRAQQSHFIMCAVRVL